MGKTGEGFCWAEGSALPYLLISPWKRRYGLLAACSARHGGVSQGPYATLNLGFSNDDQPWRVQLNRDRFFQAVGVSDKRITAGRQVHGTTIIAVDEENPVHSGANASSELRGDGLVTVDRGVALTAYFADCVPLYFVDPVSGALGLAHAGWRGSVAGIGPQMVAAMQQRYGSAPDCLLVGIGPSIGPCCYEVGAEVATAVESLGDEAAGILTRVSSTRWHCDLRTLNQVLLQQVGVKAQNVITAACCTRCRNQDFFSYRGQQGKTGSLAAVIAWQDANN